MENTPHVSIGLSTYNEGPFVARTVAAMLEGTAYPDFDILVHDDGSTDGSCEHLPNDSRLRVMRSEARHGVAGGKKLAVEASEGPLLLAMDCHVAPRDPRWLYNLVDALGSLHDRAIVSPVSVPLDSATWELKLSRPFVLTRLRNTFHVSWWRELKQSTPCEVSALRGIAKLMTREVYDAIGGFDETLTYGGEESDVSMRAWMAGLTCAYVPASVIGHVFKHRSQFPRSYAEETVKRLRVAFKCLSDASFAKVLKHNQDFLEHAGAWGPGVFESAWAQFQNELPGVANARDDLRKRSVHAGEWVFERFGIEL